MEEALSNAVQTRSDVNNSVIANFSKHRQKEQAICGSYKKLSNSPVKMCRQYRRVQPTAFVMLSEIEGECFTNQNHKDS